MKKIVTDKAKLKQVSGGQAAFHNKPITEDDTNTNDSLLEVGQAEAESIPEPTINEMLAADLEADRQEENDENDKPQILFNLDRGNAKEIFEGIHNIVKNYADKYHKDDACVIKDNEGVYNNIDIEIYPPMNFLTEAGEKVTLPEQVAFLSLVAESIVLALAADKDLAELLKEYPSVFLEKIHDSQNVSIGSSALEFAEVKNLVEPFDKSQPDIVAKIFDSSFIKEHIEGTLMFIHDHPNETLFITRSMFNPAHFSNSMEHPYYERQAINDVIFMVINLMEKIDFIR